jgi:CIC family chloride channel protein
VVGIVPLKTLEAAVAEGAAPRTVGELISRNQGKDFPHLHVDHTLSLALERMGSTQLDVLPIVSRADVHKLEGVIVLTDVLALYGFGAMP